MKAEEIAALRIIAQGLDGGSERSPQDVVQHMCAMQAQDLAMSKWAVGIRSSGTTEAEVNTALDRGDILRTHVLRPTWHLVAKEDMRWMLELTAPRIKAAMLSNGKRRGLNDAVFKQSNKVIAKALSSGKHLVRAELQAALEKAQLPTDDNRLSHMLMRAELDAICCSGAAEGKQSTHALLEERAPNIERISRDEAFERLATRYFTGHGPATLKDFIWWSGLTMTDAKHALDAARSNFMEERIGANTFFMPVSMPTPMPDRRAVHLLPAFDEFIIGYADRSAVLEPVAQRRVLSSNGIFYPALIRDGKAIGSWKRTFGNQHVSVEVAPFSKLGPTDLKAIAKAASVLGRFLQKPVEIVG